MGKLVGKSKKNWRIGNKNAEVWTEDIALKLADDLIDWLSEEPEYHTDNFGNPTKLMRSNLFFKYFLASRGLYDDLIARLCGKFESFNKKIEYAKFIQEAKLNELGAIGALNPTMTIFLLKHHHGYKDRTETNFLSNGTGLPQPIINISPILTTISPE